MRRNSPRIRTITRRAADRIRNHAREGAGLGQGFPYVQTYFFTGSGNNKSISYRYVYFTMLLVTYIIIFGGEEAGRRLESLFPMWTNGGDLLEGYFATERYAECTNNGGSDCSRDNLMHRNLQLAMKIIS